MSEGDKMRQIGKSSVFGVLAIFGAALFLAVPSFGQDQRSLQKLSAHTCAYVGTKNASPSANSFGANSGVVIGGDAVLVVDTLISAREAEKLLTDIRKVTDRPIKYVVNTHYHLDHAWGNSVFVNNGAIVIAHENSRLSASKSQYALDRYQEFGLSAADMEGTVLKFPTVTFKDAMRVDLGGGVIVDLSYPGASHTLDSITVIVSPDQVLFTGDVLFTKYHPYLAEGDIPSWEKVLTGLEKTTAKVIVPGHGPVSTIADIKDMEVYIKVFDQKAKQLSKGKKQDDAPVVAKELLKALPEQGRTETTGMVEGNLREKYLPKANTAPGSK
jgi:glyoxylase-like metal-dependent hydrolase (beta-lactamase superfamily II)